MPSISVSTNIISHIAFGVYIPMSTPGESLLLRSPVSGSCTERYDEYATKKIIARVLDFWRGFSIRMVQHQYSVDLGFRHV